MKQKPWARGAGGGGYCLLIPQTLVQLSFLKQTRTAHSGNGATYSGLDLPTSINPTDQSDPGHPFIETSFSGSSRLCQVDTNNEATFKAVPFLSKCVPDWTLSYVTTCHHFTKKTLHSVGASQLNACKHNSLLPRSVFPTRKTLSYPNSTS